MFNLNDVYLKLEMVPTIIQAALVSTSWTQVMGRDPLRYSAVLPGSGGVASLNYLFGPSIPNGPEFGSGGTVATVVTRDQIGDMITEPLWAISSSGAVNVPIVTFSYNPQRFDIYLRLLDEYISKSGS